VRQFVAKGNILRVVRRVAQNGDERRERLSGYFCVIPLSSEAAEFVRTDRLRGGEINLSHVPANSATAAALYIGAVAARDWSSRAVVIEALQNHVLSALKGGVRRVLTRPMTEEGLRLVQGKNVQGHSFRPIGSPGIDHLYELSVQE
jgi:hypothetical protein